MNAEMWTINSSTRNNNWIKEYYWNKVIWINNKSHFIYEDDSIVSIKLENLLKVNKNIIDILNNDEAMWSAIAFEDIVYNNLPSFNYEKIEWFIGVNKPSFEDFTSNTRNAKKIYDWLSSIDYIKKEWSKFLNENPDCKFTNTILDILK